MAEAPDAPHVIAPKALLDLVQDAVIVSDLDNRIRYWNRGAETMYGWSAGEAVGRPAHELLETRFPDSYPATRAALLQQGHFEAELEHTTRDHRTIVVSSHWTVQRSESGEPVAFLRVNRDLTARRRDEQHTQRQNAVLHGINRILTEALTCETDEELGRVCLAVAEEVTQSPIGFIAEINPQTGQFNDLAFSNPAGDLCRMRVQEGHGRTRPAGSAIHGIYGRVLKDGQSFFTNEPDTHPDRIGLPEGHLPLKAFLGVPLKQGGRITGMIGLGNREGGYGAGQLEAAEALAPAVVQAFQSKRAEQALRASEQRNRHVMENIAEGIWLIDADHRTTFVNPHLARMLDTTVEDMQGRNVEEFVFPEHRNTVRERLARRRQGVTERQEMVMRRADGTPLDVSLISSPVFDAQGNYGGAMAAVTDITGRKRTEGALDRQRELLQSIVDNIPVMLCMFDPRLKEFHFNRHFRAVLGYTEADGAGGDFMAKVYPDPAEREAVSQYMQSLETGWRDFYTTARDGTRVLCSWANIWLSDETYVGIGLDIRERRQAEAALRESELKYRTFFENMREALVILRAVRDATGAIVDGEYVDANVNAASVYGKTPDELRGQRMSELVPPGDFAERMAQLPEILRTGEPWSFETHIAGRHQLVFAFRMDSETIAVSALDITERKRAEEAVAAARAAAEERARMLAALMEYVPEGITIADAPDVKVRMVSRYGQELLGAPHAEMTVEEIIARWSVFRPDGVTPMPTEELPLVRAVTRGETVRDMEFVQISTDGRRLHLLCNAGPIRDGEGAITGGIVTWRDISERKRIEAALRDSQARLEAALDSMTDAVFISDAEGRFTDFNHAFATFHKFRSKEECSRAFADYPAILDVFFADGAPAPVEMWAVPRALRGETVTNAEYILRRKDTGERWVGSYSFSPIRDQKGTIVGSVVVGRDITDRKQAEDTLRRTVRRLDLLSRTASELLVANEPQRVVYDLCREVMEHLDCHVFFNFLADPAARRLRLNAYAGISEEQAARLEWLDYGQAVCGLAAKHARRVVAQHIQATTDAPAQLVRGYGVKAYCAHPLLGHGGQVLGTLSFGTRSRETFSEDDLMLMKAVADQVAVAITRKQGEVALRDSEERFREMADGLPFVLWVHNAEGQHEFVNNTYCEFFDTTLEALQDGRWQLLVHPDDAEAYVGEFLACHREHRPFHAECRVKNAKGEWRWIESFGRPRFSIDGQFMGFIGASPDITERKAAEEQIKRYSEELERLVVERTEQIQKLERQRLESERQVAVGRMAARIAHEINNPLAGVKNSFRLVKGAIPADHPHYEFVGRIDKEIDRIARIVRQMFELYRPHRVEAQVLHAEPVIRDVIALLAGNLNAQGVAVQLDVAAAAPAIKLHQDSLKQILFNVLQNAIEASPAGSTIDVQAAIREQWLHLKVVDHGCGIPEDVRARIFDPFFSTKEGLASGGMGLGLSVVRGLVDSMGGVIHFESEEGKGTAFLIALPVELAEDAPSAEQ